MNSEYGTYRLTYTPPNDPNADYPLINIDMSTEGCASVDQILRFFEALLAAAGYILKGDLQVVESEKDPWESPYNYVTAGGSQATDFISFENWSSMPPGTLSASAGGDVIAFGTK
jgi:hypothetical protein